MAQAASSVPSSVVTIDPARILDTRDPLNVGLAGPFVSAVSQKLQVTGSVPTTTGTRTVVPPGATGVLLNVTVVAPAAAGFVSIRPGDATGAPSTSSLNFNAGDIIPNAVQVGLPTFGQIDITYDAFGVAGPSTDLLIDVVGYMVAVDAGSDAALLARIEALEAAQPFAVTALNVNGGADVTPTDRVVVAVSVTAPVAGQVTVNSTTTAFQSTAGNSVRCSITTGTSIDLAYLQRWESPGSNVSQLAGTRTFNVAAGAIGTYNLVCDHSGPAGESSVFSPVLTAIFTPAP